MKMMRNTLMAMLLCMCVLFCCNFRADASELSRTVWVTADRKSLPDGVCWIDLLVPEKEAVVIDYNETNGNFFSIFRDSEIVRYCEKGYVSLTFRTGVERPDPDLVYNVSFSVTSDEYEEKRELFFPVDRYGQDDGDLIYYYIPVAVGSEKEEACLRIASDISGVRVEDTASSAFYYEPAVLASPDAKSFSSFRVACLDRNGRVLSVSKSKKLSAGAGWDTQLHLSGETLSQVIEEDYYYTPVLPIAIAAAVTLLVAVVFLYILRLVRLRGRRKLLPSLFFEKTKMTGPVSRRKTGGAWCYFLLQIVYIVAVCWIFFRSSGVLNLYGADSSGGSVFVELFVYLLFVVLNCVLHELAHYAVGKKCGFRTTYLMICGFGFQKKEGKWRLKYHGFGFGGFDAIAPPEQPLADVRFAPMYLAGAAANLLIGIVSFALCLLPLSSFVRSLFLIGAIQSLFLAVTNAVPGLVPDGATDGTQLSHLRKSPEAAEVHADNMRITASYYEGTPFAQMPEAWFRDPTEESLATRHGATNAALLFDRLLEKGLYAEALRLGQRLTAPESAIYGPARRRVLIQLVFCFAVTGSGEEATEACFTRERRAFVLRMRPSGEQIYSKYAWELLVEQNPAAAEKTRAYYEKRIEKRLLPVSSMTTRMLMDACDSLVNH